MNKNRKNRTSSFGVATLCMVALNLTPPQTSFAGSSVSSLQLDLEVQALCMFSNQTHTMDLGGYSGVLVVEGSVDISIVCNDTAVQWTLFAGLGSNTISCLDRKLTDAVSGNTLTYSLAPEPSHTVPICEGPNDGLTGWGSGVPTLYGKIEKFAGTVVDGATYSDTVILTLSF